MRIHFYHFLRSFVHSFFQLIDLLILIGGLAVGVPGELRGLKKAHEKYGKLSWDELIQPSIDLAEEGTVIGKHMYKYLKSSSTGSKVKADPGLR